MVPNMFFGLMNAPVSIDMQFLNFPENDRRDQTLTWYIKLGDVRVIMIQSLEPVMSEENWQKELQRLESENGVDLAKYKFTRPQTDPNYELKSLGDDFTNPPARE